MHRCKQAALSTEIDVRPSLECISETGFYQNNVLGVWILVANLFNTKPT